MSHLQEVISEDTYDRYSMESAALYGKKAKEGLTEVEQARRDFIEKALMVIDGEVDAWTGSCLDVGGGPV